jgi:tripartite-type tricarboxylate transporter receptor subunit TctC
MERKFSIGKWAFLVLLIAATVPFLVETLHSQDFPTKPINLVNPTGVGGSSDLTFRTFLHLAPEVFGQPMIQQMKPGGGGAIGSELVFQAKPDGYTLLVAHSNHSSVLPAVEGRSRGPEDLAPVCRINTQDTVVWVRSDSPFKTFTEMIDWAKANPGKLTFGTIGTWSWTDFEWKWQEYKAGIKSRIVTYDGGGDGLIALLGGHIQASMLFPTQSLPHYRAGKLRPLCIYGINRYPELPNVPAITEEGFSPASRGGIWKGVAAPKGTPRPIIDKLAAGFKKMMENTQAIESLKKLGDEFGYLGPDEFEKFWREDYQVFKKLAETLKK